MGGLERFFLTEESGFICCPFRGDRGPICRCPLLSCLQEQGLGSCREGFEDHDGDFGQGRPVCSIPSRPISQEEHQGRGCCWRLRQAEDERFVKEPFRCHGRERSPRPSRTRHLLIQHHHGCAQGRGYLHRFDCQGLGCPHEGGGGGYHRPLPQEGTEEPHLVRGQARDHGRNGRLNR